MTDALCHKLLPDGTRCGLPITDYGRPGDFMHDVKCTCDLEYDGWQNCPYSDELADHHEAIPPTSTPLDEARTLQWERNNLIDMAMSQGVDQEIAEQALARLVAAAKAEAVEPIALALLEPTAITCDGDGVVLSDRLVRAIEGIAEAHMGGE